MRPPLLPSLSSPPHGRAHGRRRLPGRCAHGLAAGAAKAGGGPPTAPAAGAAAASEARPSTRRGERQWCWQPAVAPRAAACGRARTAVPNALLSHKTPAVRSAPPPTARRSVLGGRRRAGDKRAVWPHAMAAAETSSAAARSRNSRGRPPDPSRSGRKRCPSPPRHPFALPAGHIPPAAATVCWLRPPRLLPVVLFPTTHPTIISLAGRLCGRSGDLQLPTPATPVMWRTVQVLVCSLSTDLAGTAAAGVTAVTTAPTLPSNHMSMSLLGWASTLHYCTTSCPNTSELVETGLFLTCAADVRAPDAQERS